MPPLAFNPLSSLLANSSTASPNTHDLIDPLPNSTCVLLGIALGSLMFAARRIAPQVQAYFASEQGRNPTADDRITQLAQQFL